MKTGIIIGGTLEMIALGWMNIGAAVAPDAALASIISTILAQRQQISFSSGGTSEEELLDREEGGVSELLELLLESPCARI